MSTVSTDSCPFEPSLCGLRSPLPGNEISGAEKNAPIRRPNHGSAVSETQRSHNKPANSGPFSTTTGNFRNRRNAWWGWKDSNLQTRDYELAFQPDALSVDVSRLVQLANTADFRLNFQPKKSVHAKTERTVETSMSMLVSPPCPGLRWCKYPHRRETP